MIEGLKPYAEYKNTGQDWLGELPAHWGLRRAKYLFREIDERSQTGKEELMSVSHLTGVTPRSQKSVTMFLAESNVGYKVCQMDDVVINTMWAWMAALGVARQTGIVSPAYGVYHPLAVDCFLPRYADLLLRTPTYAAEYQRRSTGVNSSRLRLYPENFLRIPLIYPPTEEQAAIVRFLDHANRKIDLFIRSKRRLIGLLNEQKQVIINHAVTKGLDPDVPMKNSGVMRLGRVPEHWQLKRLKFICRFAYGDSLSAENRNDGDVFVFGSNGIVGKHSEANTNAPCIIVGRKGSYGKVNYSYFSGFAIDTTYFIDKTQTDSELRWLYYALQCLGLDTISQDTCIPGLSRESAYCNTLPYIKKNEQLAIASFLDRETAKLDALIATTRDAIALLREFRTRLIFDVVTGKLDVRDVKLPAIDEVEVLEEIDTNEETEAEELIESEEVTDADN
ncbi:MAG: restriction endonuclease subunit S [Desulfobacterium sp.]|nr:restriction endonuclease subunit S [Desulfobacterium sp.]